MQAIFFARHRPKHVAKFDNLFFVFGLSTFKAHGCETFQKSSTSTKAQNKDFFHGYVWEARGPTQSSDLQPQNPKLLGERPFQNNRPKIAARNRTNFSRSLETEYPFTSRV